MSTIIGRLGRAELTLTAGQSLVVASPGAGNTLISTAGVLNPQVNPVIYAAFAVLNNAAGYYTFAQATLVRIEACNGGEVEYDYGATPCLVNNELATATGLTAHAGGGQANALTLPGNINRIATVASAGDSVLLPVGIPGQQVSVFNAGANSMNVFPQTGGNIGSGGANAAFAVAASKGALFICAAAGVWNVILSA